MTTHGPQGAGPPGEGETPPSEEELQAALEEQMRRLTVPDVLVQTVVTLVNLGARKLGLTGEPSAGGEAPEAGGGRDLEQARLAIEGTRAILPLLPGDLGPIREALSQLQMAYARAAGAGAGAPAPATPEPSSPTGAPGPGEAPSAGPPPAPAEDHERAAARSRIWTPPGS